MCADLSTAQLALGVWRWWPDDPVRPIAGDDSKPPVVQVVGQWRITPAGNADFQVIESSLVRLDRGELLVESTAEEKLGTCEVEKTSLHIKAP